MNVAPPLYEEERRLARRRVEIQAPDFEQQFDDLVLLASHICGTPIAMISLVGENRQWVKSTTGMTATETTRDLVFGAPGVLQAEVFVARQAPADGGVAVNAAIRFYAHAAPMPPESRAPSLSEVNAPEPRALGEDQLVALRALSRQVVAFFELKRNVAELRLTVRQLNRTEESLRDSEAKFHQLADAISDVFWIISPDFRTLHFVSPGYELIWGRSTASLYADPYQWIEAIVPEDRERVLAVFRTLVGNAPRVSVQYRIARPDGTIRWVDDRGFQVRDGAGKVIRFTGVATDITERKQAEEETRELATRLTTTLESLTDGFFTIDREWRFTYVNREAERMFGLSRTELLGQHIWAKFPEARGTISQQEYERALRDNVVVQFDTFYPPLGIWFDARAFPSTQGLAVYFRDVTEIRQAVTELRASEERFVGAFEHAPIGMGLVSTEGRWLKVNHVLCDLVGYSEAELLTRTFQEITHPDDLARDLEHARRLLAGETQFYQIEKRYFHHRGHIVTILLNVSLVRDGGGQPLYFIAQIQDITGRKEADARLEKAHEEMVDLSRQAGMAEVATGVLHNVGNVLNSVNVSATVVTDQLRNSKAGNLIKIGAMLRAHPGDLSDFLVHDPKGRKIPGYLLTLADQLAEESRTATEELGHLRKNIEHIKDIVSMQQNCAKVSGVAETVAMTELVEDALRMNASGLARHGLEIVREFAPGLLITVERHKVLQVLVNLIGNAKHACDDSLRPDKRLTIRITGAGAGIRVGISDNGVGIAPENLTRIFAHGFTTRKEGHGFGLHSGALAAKALGGSLSVQSDGPGCGATFTLELPLQPGLLS